MNTQPTTKAKRTVGLAAAIAVAGMLGPSGGATSARIDVPTPHAERATVLAVHRPSPEAAVIVLGRCPRNSLRYVIACAW